MDISAKEALAQSDEALDFLMWMEREVDEDLYFWEDCDESDHVYLIDGTFLGGYAGDDGTYFLRPSPQLDALMERFNATE